MLDACAMLGHVKEHQLVHVSGALHNRVPHMVVLETPEIVTNENGRYGTFHGLNLSIHVTRCK